MKEIWLAFWEVDRDGRTDGRLSLVDKYWLLYWNFMSSVGVVLLFLLVMGINNIYINHKNNRYVEETMRMVAAYMASATKDEYDDIAKSIRHDLVFSEYGEDIENFIRYIPNTAETCPACMGSYPSQESLILR